jgi:hypothetical protein
VGASNKSRSQTSQIRLTQNLGTEGYAHTQKGIRIHKTPRRRISPPCVRACGANAFDLIGFDMRARRSGARLVRGSAHTYDTMCHATRRTRLRRASWTPRGRGPVGPRVPVGARQRIRVRLVVISTAGGARSTRDTDERLSMVVTQELATVPRHPLPNQVKAQLTRHHTHTHTLNFPAQSHVHASPTPPPPQPCAPCEARAVAAAAREHGVVL